MSSEMASIIHRRLLETAESVATAAAKAPGETANRTAGADISQADFDTNMVIILAALLCALVCALGVNSVVRCALRCSRGETAEQSAARISGTGLKKSVLRKIPIFVYGTDHHGSGMNLSPGAECPICLGEFVDGDKVRVLPKCHHGFHVRCIDTWLGSHSSCPNCRHSLVDAAGSVKAAPPSEGGGDDGGGGRVNGQEHVVVELNTLGS